MKSVTKVMIGIVTVVTAAMQSPALQQLVISFFVHHPGVASLLAGVSGVTALAHDPKSN